MKRGLVRTAVVLDALGVLSLSALLIFNTWHPGDYYGEPNGPGARFEHQLAVTWVAAVLLPLFLLSLVAAFWPNPPEED